MDFSFEDGKRLWSLLWNEEELIVKKRRLLMGSLTASTSEGSRKKFKRPKFLREMYLPESFVRDDEAFSDLRLSRNAVGIHELGYPYQITSETVRTTVERSFTCSNGSCNVVKNYLRLFETHDNEDNCKNGLRLKQLSNSVRNPRNYHEEQFVFNTPTSRLCRTSIYNMLEELDEMSYQELSATNRKLRGVSLVPQFPPVRCSGKRDLLIERVRKRFKNFLSKLKDGDVLPEALAKALSIIYLSFKHRSRHIDMLTSEFYPFSPQTVGLHNDIIKALWLLPKVKYDELKALQALLDPKAEVPIKCFRNTLRKYLIEYLFECSEGHVTEEVLKTLDVINRRMQTQTFVFSEERIKEDIEAVMTVSCQLRQITSSLFSDQSDDDKQCSMGFGNDENIDTFNLVGNDYFFSPDDNEHGQIYGSCSNYEADVNQDTVLGISTSITTSSNSFVLTEAANKSSGNSSKKHELEHDVDIDIEKPCFEESIKLCPERTSRNTGSMGVKSVQEVCDETALVAYKLIGSMLDKLLKTEGKDADMLTRSHLNGGLPVPADLQGAEDLLKTSKENARSHIFGQAVEELVPSLSKSCIRRVKNLMEC